MTIRSKITSGLAYATSVLIASATVASCSGTEGATGPNRAGGASGREASASSHAPGRISNEFGMMYRGAYKDRPRARLSDRPYRGRGLQLEDFYTYAGVETTRQLAEQARVVVRGTVTNIGPPHFNSSDGGFWDPALHDEPGVTDIAAELLRDVTISIVEVWGDTEKTIQTGQRLTFTAKGGQVKLEIAEETALALGWPVRASYVLASKPEVDVVQGEEAVFFLDYAAIDGLYDNRYGTLRRLAPANELAYKFTILNDTAINASNPHLNASVSDLKAAVARYLGQQAGPLPAVGFTPAQKHEPVSGGSEPTETTEPKHDHGQD